MQCVICIRFPTVVAHKVNDPSFVVKFRQKKINIHLSMYALMPNYKHYDYHILCT
jgi:hypothetical protein